MLNLPLDVVYKKIVQTGKLAEKLGAKILGLGAFTSVVGDGGITIAKQLDIPVTSGDSYTVAVAVEAVVKAAQMLDVDLTKAKGAVVGATGAIGRVCAQLLAQNVPELLLIGRRNNSLNEVKCLVDQSGTARVKVSTSIEDLKQAEVIITVSSAVESIIQPDHLKSGAVVCDVARPRDVSWQIAKKRKDVLVIDGGIVEVPGPVNFNFDFGFPAKMTFACMAETMILAMAQKYENFTLGKEIALSQVQEIDRLAKSHGFRLGGLRSFETPVTDSYLESVKAHIKI